MRNSDAANDGRSRRQPGPTESDPHANGDDWTVIDGRRYFIAGHTSNGVPYGIFEDEFNDQTPLCLDQQAETSTPDTGQ
jgi:hypothetical protein